MADFNTAKHWLKQGKKVTRECWESHSYWKLGVDQIIFYSDGTKATVHINQIEARDWMIFEEDFCLGKYWEYFKELNSQNKILGVKNFEDAIKKSVELLKKELYKDPEPCCHGIRQRDAFKIIDKFAGNTLAPMEELYGYY